MAIGSPSLDDRSSRTDAQSAGEDDIAVAGDAKLELVGECEEREPA